jgi:hypothetical protein
VRRDGGQRISRPSALVLFRWRRTLHQTAGPVEHVKVSCPDRHRFLIPAIMLDQADTSICEPRDDMTSRGQP